MGQEAVTLVLSFIRQTISLSATQNQYALLSSENHLQYLRWHMLEIVALGRWSQGHPWQCMELEASLGYITLDCISKKKKGLHHCYFLKVYLSGNSMSKGSYLIPSKYLKRSPCAWD